MSRWSDRLLRVACRLALSLSVACVLAMLLALVVFGLPRLFDAPEELVASAILTLHITLLTALFAIPTGIGAAIYVEEYARGSRLGALIDRSVEQLGSLPSVVYGLIGAQAFMLLMYIGFAPLAAALTLTLMILPVVTDGARAALREVPESLREAGLALGASRWQVTRGVLLPHALPGMFAASLRALARVIGDATPVVVLGLGVLPEFGGLEVAEAPVPLSALAFTHAHAPEQMPSGAFMLLLSMTLTLCTVAALQRGSRRAGQ